MQEYGRLRVALLLLVAGSLPGQAAGELQELTAEQLADYAFEVTATEATVAELSAGQGYVLRTWRREIAGLAARRLGVVRLRGDQRDLPTLQALVDNQHIKPGDVPAWQGLGIVFGDLLARELGLHWVSYEDDLGLSKALRYQETENYVFPVTLFSKRVAANETIDLAKIFARLAADLEAIKARGRFD